VKKYSIIFTINIIFLISFILITVSFFTFYNFNNQKERHITHKREIEISKIFIHQYRVGGISEELREYIKNLDFSLISNENEIKKIVDNAQTKAKELKSKGMFKLQHIELKDKSFVLIQTPNERVMLTSNSILNENRNTIFIVYIMMVLIFIFLYFSIINKLKPLKVLKDDVKSFGDEDFDLNCFSSNSDEISELANEFHKSAKKLKKLKESRTVFIRNIMHELKTPITKGKFLMQLPQTSQNTQSMQKVFYRLESLINEFASIEELISTKKELHKKEYFLEDIIDNAVDLLMSNDEEVIKEFDNIKIKVDFNIFSIALKNLLDNGIKYSKERRVIVKTEANKLIFENSGTSLIYPIESYFEPFFRGDNANLNQSFGLGLYIVKHILDAHNMSLKYEHENGINRFIISS
jgi:two-component system OmpR family sensor kinase